MTESADYHIKPIKQLLYLILVFLAFTLLANLLWLALVAILYGKNITDQLQGVSKGSPQEVINALKFFLALGTTIGMFLAPALYFSRFIVYNVDDYIKPTTKFSNLLLPLVFAIMIASLPVMEMLININAKLVLPEFLKGVERWMRQSEDETSRMVEAVLQTDTIAHLIVSMLIVAVLPAIGEEFMFRGCLQTIFGQWTGNKHAAIWITAFIFSAMHLQFFGFLPRLMLGALFGYMAAYSGSIWPGVWAHFLNNGAAVIATYLYQNKKSSIDPNSDHIFNYSTYIISFIIILFLFRIFKNVASGKRTIPEY
ncbi:CPBP family intramembrane metalloprotease [Mucilaginibacter sp. UR6-1]|uniref:CPBP family intramembrane glutamic endopeptidase n=1 Tax=Mucilaginibacter sp. UR6-1 TaxID=1435643 RepID=UPI001E3ADF9D|nr:CPBP family intramembrane glutamic endopeptidase [Mucilaginibacter sp. UR6-1]MCC8410518.1 CPBP family intramembrane metalloprotease [Mucilaginibacter sp. UR6-1]